MSEAQANKYLEWSKEDLIKRILDLEKYVIFFSFFDFKYQ